jgi:thiol-disulfide isomerase/thioredoxin
MTASRRQHLKFASAVVCGLFFAVALIVLVAYVAKAFIIGYSTNGAMGPKVAAVASVLPETRSAAMILHDKPRLLNELQFKDGDDRPLTLAEFRGKVVLLNIWATWCGPCRREMPTLDQLQAKFARLDFEVVALSIDPTGPQAVAKFYEEIGVKHLVKYIDESGKAARDLKALGLPTTLLINREGLEIGRYVGPAEWNSPEMMVFFEEQLTQGGDTLWFDRESKSAGGPMDRSTTSSSSLNEP